VASLLNADLRIITLVTNPAAGFAVLVFDESIN
jgi:hypothetical protein